MRTRQALLSRRPRFSLWTLWITTTKMLMYNSYIVSFFMYSHRVLIKMVKSTGWIDKEVVTRSKSTWDPSKTLRTAESSGWTTSRFGPKTLWVWIKELLGWRVCWYRCWVLMRYEASAQKQTRSFATIRHSCYNTEYKWVKEPDGNARRLMNWSSRAANDRRRIQVGLQKYSSTTVSFWAALGPLFKYPPETLWGHARAPPQHTCTHACTHARGCTRLKAWALRKS